MDTDTASKFEAILQIFLDDMADVDCDRETYRIALKGAISDIEWCAGAKE